MNETDRTRAHLFAAVIAFAGLAMSLTGHLLAACLQWFFAALMVSLSYVPPKSQK